LDQVRFVHGDILEAQTEALVNTVNTVGVMGKGVALAFKRRFPDNYEFYRQACERGEVQIGRMLVFETGRLQPRYIINFPTKRHWRERSELVYIEQGLRDLVRKVRDLDIRSVAVPALGCGNGGLDWKEVRRLIIKAFEPLKDVKVLVFEPQSVSRPQQRHPIERAPIAAWIYLTAMYGQIEEEITDREVYQLARLLHLEGLSVYKSRRKDGDLAFSTVQRKCRQLEKLGYLAAWHGYRGRKLYRVPAEILEVAQQVLERKPKALAAVERVARRMEGFESAYALRLLTEVLRFRKHHHLFRDDVSLLQEQVTNKLRQEGIAIKSTLLSHIHQTLEHVRRQSEKGRATQTQVQDEMVCGPCFSVPAKGR
jgi:O-acetyl-ADP-ribose deacetylase (regulator of RNase III)